MKYDAYGQVLVDSQNLVDWLYQRPDLDLAGITVLDPEQYNTSIDQLHLDWPKLAQYREPNQTIEEFDRNNQNSWFLPDTYKNFDIARWLIEQCSTDAELDRVADELMEFDRRNLMPLLTYLKYLVDTMREHGIVWGVGRGSSVASFVLYKIGVHRINSLEYGLEISEFLKE